MSCFEKEINVDKYVNINNYLSINFTDINNLPININDIYKILSIENNKYFFMLLENLNKTIPDKEFFTDSATLNQVFKFYLNCSDIDIIDSYFSRNKYIINIYKTDYLTIKQDTINYMPTVCGNDDGFTINIQKNKNTYNCQTIPTVVKSTSIIISLKGNF